MSKLLSQTIYDCLVGAPEADKFAQSPDPSVFQPVSQTSLLKPIGLAPIGGIVTFDFSRDSSSRFPIVSQTTASDSKSDNDEAMRLYKSTVSCDRGVFDAPLQPKDSPAPYTTSYGSIYAPAQVQEQQTQPKQQQTRAPAPTSPSKGLYKSPDKASKDYWYKSILGSK